MEASQRAKVAYYLYAHVESHIRYCLVIWGGTSAGKLTYYNKIYLTATCARNSRTWREGKRRSLSTTVWQEQRSGDLWEDRQNVCDKPLIQTQTIPAAHCVCALSYGISQFLWLSLFYLCVVILPCFLLFIL